MPKECQKSQKNAKKRQKEPNNAKKANCLGTQNYLFTSDIYIAFH